MDENILYIKNMVCDRCIKVVREELAQAGLEIEKIELGKVYLKKEPDDTQRREIEERLVKNGFELMDDSKSRTVEQIKTMVINLIHYERERDLSVNLSDFISSKLNLGYPYLSNLFSSMEGITIEKYYINQKIEKVKELLVYDELTLSEIAVQLGYSSVQYLSNQFKKVTGMTPSRFKDLKEKERKPLDKV